MLMMLKTRAAHRSAIAQPALALLLILELASLGCLVRASTAVNGSVERALVDLASLPDLFGDDKLPVAPANPTRCYRLMGCLEPPPISSWPTDPFLMETKFLLYAKSQREASIEFKQVENCLKGEPGDCRVYPFNLRSLLESPFEATRRTIILVSGYLTRPPTDWELGVKRIWLELEDVNVIIVNWAGSNGGAYPIAATNARLVARQITVLLYYLAKLSGLELADDSFCERIYMVGHSLGAHIAGFVGSDLGGALGRITGLDPAGPDFDQLHERFRLDRSDALLVDAIHSNGGAVLFSMHHQRYGTGLMSGHVDLYANDGSHQPGCSSDMLGCSHGKSNKYYMAFLQHELSMRNYLNENYTSLYRLRAYASDHYDSFKNATSLVRGCPRSALSDHDLFSSDIDRCTIPVDYYTWYSQVREELETRHGIDFGAQSRRNNSYYFYTAAETDDQMDHYLLKARIEKRGRGQPAAALKPAASGGGTMDSNAWKAPGYKQPNDRCDISFEVTMRSRLDMRYKISQYRLLDEGSHYKIVAPYLSTNIITKYQLSKLDSQDYNLVHQPDDNKLAQKVIGNETELRKSLLQIFPQSIELRASQADEAAAEQRREERENPGFMGTIKNLFNMVRGKQSADSDEQAAGRLPSCNLTINHLIVRPLTRLHRDLIAYYSIKLLPNSHVTYPKIVLLSGADDEAALGDEQLDFGQSAAAATTNQLETSKLHLDSIFIGPYDRSFIRPNKELDYDEILPLDGNAYEKHISSQVAPLTWALLTGLLVVLMLALAALASLRIRRVDALDKQALLMGSLATIG